MPPPKRRNAPCAGRKKAGAIFAPLLGADRDAAHHILRRERSSPAETATERPPGRHGGKAVSDAFLSSPGHTRPQKFLQTRRDIFRLYRTFSQDRHALGTTCPSRHAGKLCPFQRHGHSTHSRRSLKKKARRTLCPSGRHHALHALFQAGASSAFFGTISAGHFPRHVEIFVFQNAHSNEDSLLTTTMKSCPSRPCHHMHLPVFFMLFFCSAGRGRPVGLVSRLFFDDTQKNLRHGLREAGHIIANLLNYIIFSFIFPSRSKTFSSARWRKEAWLQPL